MVPTINLGILHADSSLRLPNSTWEIWIGWDMLLGRVKEPLQTHSSVITENASLAFLDLRQMYNWGRILDIGIESELELY